MNGKYLWEEMKQKNYLIFDRTVEESFAVFKAVKEEISSQMLKINV